MATKAKLKSETATPAGEKRPPGRPRGSLGKPREKTQQLGYRIKEFAEAVRLSIPVIRKAIAKGEIKTVMINNTLIIPVTEPKRLGLTVEET